MSPFSTLLCYDYFLNAAMLCKPFYDTPLWLLIPLCCAMTTFPTLLRYFYFFTRCCAMTTFSMMLHYVYFFNTAALCLYLFNDAPLWLLFPRCCAMTDCFHAAALCLPFPWCSTMTPFSTLLRYDYFSTPSHYVYLFPDAPLYLRFPGCCAVSTVIILLCAMSPFSTKLSYVFFFPRCSTKTTFMCWSWNFRRGGGGGGGSRSIRKKKNLWQRFSLSSPHLNLQKSNGYNFQRKPSFFKVPEGVQPFPGGGSSFFQGGGLIAYFL